MFFHSLYEAAPSSVQVLDLAARSGQRKYDVILGLSEVDVVLWDRKSSMAKVHGGRQIWAMAPLDHERDLSQYRAKQGL